LSSATAVVRLVAAESVAAAEDDDENQYDPPTRIAAQIVKTHMLNSVPPLRDGKY
jgi:hypothetical protein